MERGHGTILKRNKPKGATVARTPGTVTLRAAGDYPSRILEFFIRCRLARSRLIASAQAGLPSPHPRQQASLGGIRDDAQQ